MFPLLTFGTRSAYSTISNISSLGIDEAIWEQKQGQKGE